MTLRLFPVPDQGPQTFYNGVGFGTAHADIWRLTNSPVSVSTFAAGWLRVCNSPSIINLFGSFPGSLGRGPQTKFAGTKPPTPEWNQLRISQYSDTHSGKRAGLRRAPLPPERKKTQAERGDTTNQ